MKTGNHLLPMSLLRATGKLYSASKLSDGSSFSFSSNNQQQKWNPLSLMQVSLYVLQIKKANLRTESGNKHFRLKEILLQDKIKQCIVSGTLIRNA